MTAHDPAVDGWELALGELEAHVSMAERALGDQLWSRSLDRQPPAESGATDEFVFRARSLLRRQRALIDAIPGILAANADRPQGPPRP